MSFENHDTVARSVLSFLRHRLLRSVFKSRGFLFSGRGHSLQACQGAIAYCSLWRLKPCVHIIEVKVCSRVGSMPCFLSQVRGCVSFRGFVCVRVSVRSGQVQLQVQGPAECLKIKECSVPSVSDVSSQFLMSQVRRPAVSSVFLVSQADKCF